MADTVLFNIGIGIDKDTLHIQTDEVIEDLKKAIEQEFAIHIDASSIEDISQSVEALGGQFKIIRDTSTGVMTGISASAKNASGQMVTINQSLRAVIPTLEDVKNVMGSAFDPTQAEALLRTAQQLGSYYETSNIFSSTNAETQSMEYLKKTQEQVIALMQKRTDLQTQLRYAIEASDTRQVASLTQQISKNESLSNIYEDRLATLQSQLQLTDAFSLTYQKIFDQQEKLRDSDTDNNNILNLPSSQQIIEVSTNVKQMVDNLKEYYSLNTQMISTKPGEYYDLIQQEILDLQPEFTSTMALMQQLGVQFQNGTAIYNGNAEAVKELTDTYNELSTKQKEAFAKAADKDAILVVKDLSGAVDDYYDALTAIEKTKTSVGSEEWKNLEQTVNAANAQFANFRGTGQSVYDVLKQLGVQVTKDGASFTATYNGQNEAVKKLVQSINNQNDAYKKLRAQKIDEKNDIATINQVVDAYREYRKQYDELYKLQKSNNANFDDIKTQTALVKQLEQIYKKLEGTLLSNGQAVHSSTMYQREKNQITRESIQEQKKYDLALQSDSLQNAIAQTLKYAVSLDGLKKAISSVIDTTLELNEAMVGIQLVTQQNNEETKELMIQYSDIAKRLGTTTSAVSESAQEWLLIRSL